MIFRFINKIMTSIGSPIELKFDQSDTGSGFRTKKDVETKQHFDETGVYCKYCHTRITHPSHAIEVQGAYHHVFTNPEGVTFNIGTYDQAECQSISPPEQEYSWFAGYAWQIVICPKCQAHLGWYYSHPGSPDFYGLILDRLRE